MMIMTGLVKTKIENELSVMPPSASKGGVGEKLIKVRGNIAWSDFFILRIFFVLVGFLLVWREFKSSSCPSTMHNTKPGGSKVHFYDLIPYDNDTNLSICNAWFVFQKYPKPQKEMK